MKQWLHWSVQEGGGGVGLVDQKNVVNKMQNRLRRQGAGKREMIDEDGQESGGSGILSSSKVKVFLHPLYLDDVTQSSREKQVNKSV